MKHHKKLQAEEVLERFNAPHAALSDRETDVLMRFYGLNLQVRHSLQDIGNLYHVSRERIRQIEAKALEKIRDHSTIKKLRDY